MSLLTAKGNWNITKGKLKQRFAQLIEDEAHFIEGKQDELIGRIQKRTGQTSRASECAMTECLGWGH